MDAFVAFEVYVDNCFRMRLLEFDQFGECGYCQGGQREEGDEEG